MTDAYRGPSNSEESERREDYADGRRGLKGSERDDSASLQRHLECCKPSVRLQIAYEMVHGCAPR